MATDEVAVGVVGKPFGVHGDVYVHPDVDLDHEFPIGATYRLPDGRSLTVEESRVHGNRRLVRFGAVADRDAAEALRGVLLTVPRTDLALEEDAFWVSDLVGREVRDDAGEVVGVVEGVTDGHAHDYLLIARTDGAEILVPLVADLLEVRAEALVVRAVPGLLDDDADTV